MSSSEGEVAKPKRGRAWRVGLVVGACLLVAALPGAWYGVRTEAVCGGLVDEALGEVSSRSSLRLSRGAIAPVGWWGLEVRDVAVQRPDARPWLTVGRVYVEPDVKALLDGELRLARVSLSSLTGDLALAEGEGGDLALVRRALGRQGSGDQAQGGGASAGRGAKLWAQLPEVVVEDARLQLQDEAGRFPPMALHSQRLSLRRQGEAGAASLAVQGDVQLQGYDRGQLQVEVGLGAGTASVQLEWPERQDLSGPLLRYAPTDLLAGARLAARGVSVTWPPSATFHDVLLDHLSVEVPWAVRPDEPQGGVSGPQEEPARPRVVSAAFRTLQGFNAESGPRVLTTEARVGVALPGREQVHEVPLGHLQVELDAAQEEVRLATELQGELGLGSVRATWRPKEAHLDLTARVQDVPWEPYAPLVPVGASKHLDLRAGRVGGTFVLDSQPEAGLYDLLVDVNLDDGALRAPVMASKPLEKVHLKARARLTVDTWCGCVWLRDGQAELGRLNTTFAGRIFQVEGGWLLDFDGQVPRVDAQAVLASMPKNFAPALEGYELQGPFAASLSLRIDSRAPQDLKLGVELDTKGVKIVKPGAAVDFEALKGDFKRAALGLPDAREVGPLTPRWVPWGEIPPVVPQAIVSAEDGRFWKHNGFDPRGIFSALATNVREERLARGGSTISQQVVKNLFLNHDRTLSRKLQEAFLTWHMEQTLSKERIMEIYLNILHLGPGIYGLRDASKLIFVKPPTRLSLREAVFFGSILPNPDYFVRLYAQGQIPADRRVKMRHILENMKQLGLLGPNTFARMALLTDQGVISIAPPPKRLLDAATPDLVTEEMLDALPLEPELLDPASLKD